MKVSSFSFLETFKQKEAKRQEGNVVITIFWISVYKWSNLRNNIFFPIYLLLVYLHM